MNGAQRGGDDFLDKLPAFRREAMERIVEELYQWWPLEKHREMHLWSEYNDGITDPEPAGVRLTDTARALPATSDPVAVAMLQELGEVAQEHAAGQLGGDVVEVRPAWPPGRDVKVLRVTTSWWSLAARHPEGPVVVMLDGILGLYDVTGDPRATGPVARLSAGSG
ncbi:hypothetical protein ACIP79_40700 [Streptomyces sp. NPDC088747]|uniref:hypothetical protein n=1 Tax=Streptomyces sp. NPDC088747 TaxID=3365886 RepID=UPI003818BB0C